MARDSLFSCVLLVAFLIPVLALELAPSAYGLITIVTNPFSARDALEIIAATQGNILGAGHWPWIAVTTRSDDPDFDQKLKAAGALILLPPLTNSCLTDLALQGT